MLVVGFLFYFQFKEPDAVDEEDDVEEEEADEGADDERLAAVCVSERASKQDKDDAKAALVMLMPQSVQYRRLSTDNDNLESSVISLDLTHVLLCIFLCLIELPNVVTDCLSFVKVHFASLVDVNRPRSDTNQPNIDREKQEDGFKRYLSI